MIIYLYQYTMFACSVYVYSSSSSSGSTWVQADDRFLMKLWASVFQMMMMVKPTMVMLNSLLRKCKCVCV